MSGRISEPLSHTDGGWQLIAVAVVALARDEEVARDLVGLNPDVNDAHHLPLVNRTILLVKTTEMPCCLDTGAWYVPEAACVWKACV